MKYFVFLRNTQSSRYSFFLLIEIESIAPSKKQNFTEDDIQLALFAKALSHPARISILRHLAGIDGCCFNKISDEISLADSTVSQQQAELKKAGLVQGTIDPPRIKYCINYQNWLKAKELFNCFFRKRIEKSVNTSHR